MNENRSVLLLNIFPRNAWKEIVYSLLQYVPHDDIAIHLTLPWYKYPLIPFIKAYIKKLTKIDYLYISLNQKKFGETKGFEKFRKNIAWEKYSSATYTHSKGSSRRRKNTKAIRDWTEFMRYYNIERDDLAQKAFSDGYLLYGTNILTQDAPLRKCNDREFYAKYIFAGNFVTINISELRDKFLNTPIAHCYYGIEYFWGNLCDISKAYSPLNLDFNQYETELKPFHYKWKLKE